MKALNPSTGNLEKVYVKALDSMPVGAEIDFDGQTIDIPVGWEEITETNLTNVIVDKIKSKNLFNCNSVTLNKYVVATDGTLANYDGVFVSDYIEIEGNKTYYWNDAVTRTNLLAFYDQSKTYISGSGGSSTINTFTSPSNAKYLRINGTTADLKTYQLEKSESATDYTPYISFNNNPYVLWTNPNPLSTTFAGQSIVLNEAIENFRYYEIIFIAYANSSLSLDTFLSTGKLVGERTRLFYADNYARRRLISGVSGTNMTFGDGGSCNNYGTDTWGTNNGLCVPYQVIGYK